MKPLIVILARKGSKGLPGKNTAAVNGRSCVEWTIQYAIATGLPALVSTDSRLTAKIARTLGVEVVERPPDLCSDTASVQDAVLHAVRGRDCDEAVVLYGNVPVRPKGLIERALKVLRETGCDSVQSVCPAGRHHPDWAVYLSEDGKIGREGSIADRRQNLGECFHRDGGVVVFRPSRANAAIKDLAAELSKEAVTRNHPHAFLGRDQRAVVTRPGEVVDIDDAHDLRVARALLPKPVCPVVVAEIGINHDGDVRRAIDLIDEADNCDVDAVKFQMFDADAMGEPELGRYELSEEAWCDTRNNAAARGLGFGVTVFNVGVVGRAASLRPDFLKIASTNASDLPLIERCMETGISLVVSTGAHTLDELEPTVELLRDYPVTLMHCVSAYPCPPEMANLPRIDDLRNRFNRRIGFSDHTMSTHLGRDAFHLFAADALEKHLTDDRGRPGADHAMSVTPNELAEYVFLIRARHGRSDTTEIETGVRAKIERRSSKPEYRSKPRLQARDGEGRIGYRDEEKPGPEGVYKDKWGRVVAVVEEEEEEMTLDESIEDFAARWKERHAAQENDMETT